MKTKSTSLFIAVAAFAVTASGVHAFSSPTLLIKAGLTDEQVIAIQEAQELKATGDVAAAQEALKAAGITKETMQHIRAVAKEAKQAVKQAVIAGDYEAFQIAIVDSPLAELVTNEADFRQFAKVHYLHHDDVSKPGGDTTLFTEGGIEKMDGSTNNRTTASHKVHPALFEELTDVQREALQVAAAANDKVAVRAIFAEAGIELPERGKKVR